MVLVEATEEFQLAGMAITQGIMQARAEIHPEDSSILESLIDGESRECVMKDTTGVDRWWIVEEI